MWSVISDRHGKASISLKQVSFKDNYENVVGKVIISPVQPQKVYTALTRKMPLSDEIQKLHS